MVSHLERGVPGVEDQILDRLLEVRQFTFDPNRGVGEFDHVAWVTRKKNGPVIANILLDSVLPDDLQVPESTEKASKKITKLKTYPVRGQVYLDGSPVVGAKGGSSFKATAWSTSAL